ncbi:hypothetical protein QJQ45_003588 [Haematococcus lacustris]|nr:hypothetical protein QJQ45_003588 [Haematococcus lacustris]
MPQLTSIKAEQASSDAWPHAVYLLQNALTVKQETVKSELQIVQYDVAKLSVVHIELEGHGKLSEIGDLHGWSMLLPTTGCTLLLQGLASGSGEQASSDAWPHAEQPCWLSGSTNEKVYRRDTAHRVMAKKKRKGSDKKQHDAHWKVARISPLFKDTDPTDTNKYRMLAVSSVLYRLYANVLRHVLTAWFMAHKAEQFGFIPGRSTMHPMFILRHLVHAQKASVDAKHRKLFTAFIDFKQAYDHIPRQQLWEHLRVGVKLPQPLLACLEGLYRDDNYVLIDGPHRTPPVTPDQGVKQGCPISPLLFALYVHDISKEFLGPVGLASGSGEQASSDAWPHAEQPCWLSGSTNEKANRRDTERWLAPIKPHLQHLAAASSAGTSLEANLKHITVTLATWDAVWEVYLDPKWARQRLRLYGAQDRAMDQFFKKLEEDMAELSMERHRHAKQLVVFFGAATIGTAGGWGADAVLRACRKVVCRPRGTDQMRGRVVLVDEHRTTQVSSAVNGKQPCEVELNTLGAMRPAGWKPPAGQVEQRLLRPAWSQQRGQPVRGMMWCPEATLTAASEPGPSTPQPAKRSKRTEAEPAAEPNKAKGKTAKAKPAPQPGRWLDRDCNAALNMQRIRESRWRPLELCYWPDQGALPAKGKEYPGLGYKRVRDKPLKPQEQQQQQPAEAQ